MIDYRKPAAPVTPRIDYTHPDRVPAVAANPRSLRKGECVSLTALARETPRKMNATERLEARGIYPYSASGVLGH